MNIRGALDIETTDGDITHEGDFGVAIPETASVPIPKRIKGRRLNFTLGAGSAQMEIEAFDGEITLEKR